MNYSELIDNFWGKELNLERHGIGNKEHCILKLAKKHFNFRYDDLLVRRCWSGLLELVPKMKAKKKEYNCLWSSWYWEVDATSLFIHSEAV